MLLHTSEWTLFFLLWFKFQFLASSVTLLVLFFSFSIVTFPFCTWAHLFCNAEQASWFNEKKNKKKSETFRAFLLSSQPWWCLTTLIWVKYFIFLIRIPVTLGTLNVIPACIYWNFVNNWNLCCDHYHLFVKKKKKVKVASDSLLIIWSFIWVLPSSRTDYCFM